jgi:acetoin:2,6-dichlorophenolindophenol oxidoreductase subunit alpha
VTRSPDLAVAPGIARLFPAETSLAMFSRMCEVRAFERGVVEAVKRREITVPVYLSTGQEALAAALSLDHRGHLVFPQHRAHDIFLAFGGAPERLRDELLGLPGGTSRGRAGSNCLQLHEGGVSIFGHHGLIGENVPQGVGAALGSGRPTLCLFGDGAAEEDYVLASLGFAATHKLPVLFVCVDNHLSILTPIEARRSWSVAQVAAGFGLPARDVADDPWALLGHLRELGGDLPALLNVRVCRGFWHVGVGVDGPPEWDRFALVKATLADLGLGERAAGAEAAADRRMEAVWAR